MLVLERGEEMISTLTDFCTEEGIHNAFFQGIGAVEQVEIGYYDLATRSYVFRQEDAVFEVASLQGNVALVDGAPFVHAHAVLSRTDDSCACIGAHLKQASVAVTLEISLTDLSNSSFERQQDEAVGLKLINL